MYQLLRKFLKQHFVTVFRRNLEQPLFIKVVSEISEAVFFDRLWKKSGKTFVKSVSEISGAHFVTVFRRNLGQYRNCFGNFWSNILWPSINKFCMKPLIKSVLEVSETHLVSRISSVFLRLIVFRKFPKQHIWATRVYTTEFRDTALIKFASEISKTSFVKESISKDIRVLRILYFSIFLKLLRNFQG